MIKQKKYAPARVKNPTSIQHMVWIQPGQVLLLQLDEKMYPNVRVDTTPNDVIDILSNDKDDEKYVYFFAANEYVWDWGNYSQSHLGDIWIDSDDVSARLVLMQSSLRPEKSNFVTTVNPDCADLRIRPYDVLEVVLYDTSFRELDEWTWEWDAKCNVDMELIGADYTNMNMLRYTMQHPDSSRDPSNPYAKCMRGNSDVNPWCRQHHFWFRFDKKVTHAVESDIGLTHVGNLKFFGWENKYWKSDGYQKECFVSICSKFVREHRDQVAHTLSLKEFGNMTPTSYVGHKPSVMYHLKNFGGRKPKAKKPQLPTVMDVEINLMDYDGLEDGCNTISAIIKEGDMRGGPVGVCFPKSSYGVCGNKHYQFDCDEYKDLYDWWE